MLTKNETFDLAIITVYLQLFIFYFIYYFKKWKKGNDFHNSKNYYFCVWTTRCLHIKQPDIVSSVLLVKKPLSVHCTWIDSSFTQHRLVIQFHEQYSTNTTWFMSVKCKEILMLEKSKSRGKRINTYS